MFVVLSPSEEQRVLQEERAKHRCKRLTEVREQERLRSLKCRSEYQSRKTTVLEIASQSVQSEWESVRSDRLAQVDSQASQAALATGKAHVDAHSARIHLEVQAALDADRWSINNANAAIRGLNAESEISQRLALQARQLQERKDWRSRAMQQAKLHRQRMAANQENFQSDVEEAAEKELSYIQDNSGGSSSAVDFFNKRSAYYVERFKYPPKTKIEPSISLGAKQLSATADLGSVDNSSVSDPAAVVNHSAIAVAPIMRTHSIQNQATSRFIVEQQRTAALNRGRDALRQLQLQKECNIINQQLELQMQRVAAKKNYASVQHVQSSTRSGAAGKSMQATLTKCFESAMPVFFNSMGEKISHSDIRSQHSDSIDDVFSILLDDLDGDDVPPQPLSTFESMAPDAVDDLAALDEYGADHDSEAPPSLSGSIDNLDSFSDLRQQLMRVREQLDADTSGIQVSTAPLSSVDQIVEASLPPAASVMAESKPEMSSGTGVMDTSNGAAVHTDVSDFANSSWAPLLSKLDLLMDSTKQFHVDRDSSGIDFMLSPEYRSIGIPSSLSSSASPQSHTDDAHQPASIVEHAARSLDSLDAPTSENYVQSYHRNQQTISNSAESKESADSSSSSPMETSSPQPSGIGFFVPFENGSENENGQQSRMPVASLQQSYLQHVSQDSGSSNGIYGQSARRSRIPNPSALSPIMEVAASPKSPAARHASESKHVSKNVDSVHQRSIPVALISRLSAGQKVKLSYQEMRQLNARLYKMAPEVVKAQEKSKRIATLKASRHQTRAGNSNK